MAYESKTPQTQKVADRFYEMTQTERDWTKIMVELYDETIESYEPEGANMLPNAFGKKDVLDKASVFHNMIEERHGGAVSKPIVAGNKFALTISMDVTMKNMGRINMEEIALYTVEGDKIVKEQFFF